MNMGSPNDTKGHDRGVSPLVGEALFICIVLVLAGCLSYFIVLERQFGGPTEFALKTRIERNGDGNWLWTINRGRNDYDSSLIIKRPSGLVTVASSISTPSWFFVFNDNNGDGHLDGGDIILLNQTAGVVEPGWTVDMRHGTPSLTGDIILPN